MLHKPTQRKIPKKYDNSQQIQHQQINKAGSKPLMRGVSSSANGNRNNKDINNNNANTNQRHPSVKARVANIEQKLNNVNVSGKLSNTELQSMLIQEIKGIKNQLKQIKQHMGIQGSGSSSANRQPYQPQQQQQQARFHEQQQEQPEQQNIYQMKNNSSGSQSHHKQKIEQQQYGNRDRQRDVPNRQNISQSKYVQQPPPQQQGPRQTNYKLYEKQKQLLDVGKIQPYMKQFKIQVSKNMMPYYNGYHKKSSKPVIIKYCAENKSMEPLFNLYERLWKNIVKAKHICINKVYDINQPLATYILVIEANKYSLPQILSNRVANVSQVLCSLVKALQFFHQCGYLYRNIHPYHVMMSQQNQIVLIDLKNMKRFTDIKGKHVVVTKDDKQIQDQFMSNSRARGLKQGRKDDLQSLGYLALFILEGSLPWTMSNLVQVRSKLTLKQLCGRYGGLLEFMIAVSQMQTQDVPDYARLIESLGKI